MTDPTSRQRGRPIWTGLQLSIKINIWSWAPDGARHQDRQADWLSVAKWLWLCVFCLPFCPDDWISIVTDLINALPGNSSVNMVQHATIDEAVFSVRCPCREDIRDYGNGNWLKVRSSRGNSSVARRRIRRLSVWRYMRCSISILGVCNLVRLL
jgi:hypothetical protein